MEHDWKQTAYEPSHIYKGYLTAVQFYQCRKCKCEVGLPDALKPETHGCTGIKEEEKVKWQSPIKSRRVYEEKTDYPKKAKRR